MITNFFVQFYNNKISKLITFVFLGLFIWWVSIHFRGLTEGWENEYYTTAYSLLALLGGVYGLNYAKKWGGLKSTLGSALTMLSAGLLSQFIGTMLYSYYIFVLGVEVPYPSAGDIVFLISILLYIYGSYLIARISGASFSVQSLRSKIIAIAIPIVILLISYAVFLNGYHPDWSNLVVTFLDFGYPIGQAIYLSIALLALLFSKEILGGMMRKTIIMLISALILQFIADFAFSYQYAHSTVYAGDFLDLLYTFSYFIMAIALISIGNMFYKVQES